MNQEEVPTKKCSKCFKTKLINEFHKDVRTKDKYRTYCNSCISILGKIYRQTHKIKASLYNRQWREKNKDKKREQDRLYKANHREEARIRSKKYYYQFKNTEKYKKYHQIQRQLRNPQRRKKVKEQYQNNINFKLLIICRTRLYKALKNKHKIFHTIELFGCSINDLKRHLEQQFKNGMNWNNYGLKGWHIDHIKPCSSFDLTDPKQQKECFHYTNLQPLWAKDNLEKGNKLII
jgi:hypothetical protein